MKRLLSISASVLAYLSFAACGRDGCAGIGLSRVSPTDTTVTVGASFPAVYQQGGYCVGQNITDASYITQSATGWYSTNRTVAVVDSLTGIVTALASGNAQIGNLFVQANYGGATVHVR